jgi:hypothetical protein
MPLRLVKHIKGSRRLHNARPCASVAAKQENIHVTLPPKALEKGVPQIGVVIRILTFVKK